MKTYFEDYNEQSGIKRVVYKSCCKCSKPYIYAEIKNGVAIWSKEYKRLRDALAFATAIE